MITSDIDTAREQLNKVIDAAGRIVPFTGAGISTECGIPDFRSPGGIWTKNQPIYFDEFLSSQDARDESWRRRFAMDSYFRQAKPGRGHLALAALHKSGKVPAVITQNIDNLHQASGIEPDKVVELHGNTTYATCLDCNRRYELDWVRAKVAAGANCSPSCVCGGHIKTATVSFGQAMPVEAMQRAGALAKSCDVFLAIGSSLVVFPAAGFPVLAKECGAMLVIINREPTGLDEIADLVVRYDIGETLAPFISY